MSDLWVFGYGSLLWHPGFEHEEVAPARLHGGHRSLCVYSWVHRGTRAKPGLVLGLDRGGACRGLAFRVAADRREATIAYLRAREMVTAVYFEAWREVELVATGRRVRALAYLVNRGHEQYAGRLDLAHQLDIVRHARGDSGDNTDYVVNTARHLRELGVPDRALDWLHDRLT